VPSEPAIRFGYWMPVFGGWLRNVQDEQMEATWAYASKLARRSEQIGYDLTLIAELNLNDIKGVDAPSLDAWSTAAALAAVTTSLELMVAVRPTFHSPALFAKQAANIDHISAGHLSLNVVSSWWEQEARMYGVNFERHDDRYVRTAEWLDVLCGVWSSKTYSHAGKYYSTEQSAGTQAYPNTTSADIRRRGVRSGEEPDRAEVRCVCHAWRSTRSYRGKDPGHERTQEKIRPGTHAVWRSGLCVHATVRSRGAE
jgi:hypothetical protein